VEQKYDGGNEEGKTNENVEKFEDGCLLGCCIVLSGRILPTFQSCLLPLSSELTLVNFYQTTRRNNPEDSHIHTCHRENLKSHLEKS
jgi:hypothetical protein